MSGPPSSESPEVSGDGRIVIGGRIAHPQASFVPPSHKHEDYRFRPARRERPGNVKCPRSEPPQSVIGASTYIDNFTKTASELHSDGFLLHVPIWLFWNIDRVTGF